MADPVSQTTLSRGELDEIGGAALGKAIKELGRAAPFGAVELQFLAGVVLVAAMPGYMDLPAIGDRKP